MGSLHSTDSTIAPRHAGAVRRAQTKPNGVARSLQPANDARDMRGAAWRVSGWTMAALYSLVIWALVIGATYALISGFVR